jgi:hypothetical protein
MKKKEIKESVNEKMNIETIKSLLVELSYSKFWQPLVFITEGWRRTIEDGLKTIDPFKEPTQMARGQGQLMALGFLPNLINGEKERIAKANKKETAQG